MNSILNKKVFSILLFLLLITLLFYLANILVPFFIGLLVAYLLDPVVDFLEDNKIKRGIATTIVLIIFFFILLILCLLIFPILSIQLKTFLIEFPNIINNLNEKVNLLIEYFQKKAFQQSGYFE